jgi:hypothetical protein
MKATNEEIATAVTQLREAREEEKRAFKFMHESFPWKRYMETRDRVKITEKQLNILISEDYATDN